MSKQFIEGNVYVFTKKKLQNKLKFKILKGELSWVNKVNGHQVVINNKFGGHANGWGVRAEWCKCIKNNN